MCPKNDNYQINQVVLAQVEQIFRFGVFVRLPDDTRAYIRRRELPQIRNSDPHEVVSEGDEIEAMVIALPKPNQHLELSMRQLEPDPWETFVQAIKVHDIVTATVKNFSTGGVFVQILPGVDGFIPKAELAPWRVDQQEDLLWVGDHIEAMITQIDRKSRRVRLSIRHHLKYQVLAGKIWASLSDKETIENEIFAEEEIARLEIEEEDVDSTIAEQLGEVLVVDDHSEVRGPLVAWLRRLGFAADEAESLDQALDYLQGRSYGLALFDLELSSKDGLNVIKILGEITPDIKIAVMGDPDLIAQRSEELTALEIIDAFVKPLNLDEIRETLIHLGQDGTPHPLWISTSDLNDKETQSSFQQLEETMRGRLPLTTRIESGLQELVRFTQAEQGLVFHLASDSLQVSVIAQVGELRLNQEAILTLGESPVRDVIYERCEVFETHISRQARRRFSKLLALLSFESCLGVPILAGGEVQHALFLFHSEANVFARYRLRDARAMAMLFSVALENEALEQRIRSVSSFLLSGQLAAGFGHEVYNKMSGLEIQLRNLRADFDRLTQETDGCPSAEPPDFNKLGHATDQLLTVALDLKDTMLHFRELVQAEQQEEVNIDEAIKRAVQLLRPTANKNRVHIETTLDLDLPPIMGSTVRLQQVFANLMLNAVQHTAQKMKQWPDSPGLLQVTTAWEAEAERPIRVNFSDNGPGIHYRLWESIFGLGFSTRLGGTGLGLFIARSLLESMGGHIVVARSMIPVGTTFRVELPVRGA